MNLFHPLDRLSVRFDKLLSKKRKPMNIAQIKDRLTLFEQTVRGMRKVPVLDLQGMLSNQEKSEFQETIETLTLKLKDQEEATKLAEDLINRHQQWNADLQTRITSYQAAMNERNFAVARVTSLESDVKRLTESLKVETGNRDHFRTLVAQQDAFIKEAKRQILEFKSEALSFKSKLELEVKTKTGEAEHLAKQAVRLNEENSKLRQENAEVTSRSNQLNEQTPLLMEENRKFREQTTRLIEEKRKLQEKLSNLECQGCQTGEMGAYCGGCLGCLMRQAEHSMNESDKALRIEVSVSSYKDSIIELLTKTLKAVHEMPIIKWRRKSELVKSCTLSVTALNGNIDNIREHRIDPLRVRIPPKKA